MTYFNKTGRYKIAIFLGRISEKNKIETVIIAGKTYCVIVPLPYKKANCVPAKVAPKVLAIVFIVNMDDVVLSISDIKFSRITPLFFDNFLRVSTSKCVVPKTMASKREQQEDIASVNAIVIIK